MRLNNYGVIMSYQSQQYNRPAPRPVAPRLVIETPGHETEPVIEAALENRPNMAPFRQFGDVLSNETINFDKHGQHYTIPVYKFALMVDLQLGIPHDHPAFPSVKKLDTRFKSGYHYLEYKAPIRWMKDDNYVHIPTYTRYVINKKGTVRNAYSGLEVAPGRWGYELVRDQSKNKQSNVDLKTLKMLSFTKLPEGFIDYGYGIYSHVLDFAEGSIEWVPRKRVVVKDMQTGQTDEHLSAVHFAKTVVKDFELSGKVVFTPEIDFSKGLVTVGNYSIRHADFDPSAAVAPDYVPVTPVTLPQASQSNDMVVNQPAEVTPAQTMTGSQPELDVNAFSDTFDF